MPLPTAGNTQTKLEIIAQVIDNATPTLSRIKQRMKSINDEDLRSKEGKKKVNDMYRLSNKLLEEQAQKADKIKRKFDMNTLSYLFAGMALKRLAFGTMKSLYQTYTKATDGQDVVSQGIQRVSAGFEFLKFSIFNALNQSPIFKTMVDWAVNILNAVSKFLNLHPKTSVLFLGIISLIGLFGGALMATSLVMQVKHVIKLISMDLFGLKFGGTPLAKGLGSMTKALGTVATGGGVYGAITAVSIAIVGLFAAAGIADITTDAIFAASDSALKKIEAAKLDFSDDKSVEGVRKTFNEANLDLTIGEKIGFGIAKTMEMLTGDFSLMKNGGQGLLDIADKRRAAITDIQDSGALKNDRLSEASKHILQFVIKDGSVVVGSQTYTSDDMFSSMPP